MKLATLLVLALSYMTFLAPTAVQGSACKCDAEWGACDGLGTQGSCCAGYTCVEGDSANGAWCRVETSLTTSECTEVWGQSFSQDGCDCCPGNHCVDEGWGIQCKPNGINADCRKNKDCTASTTTTSDSSNSGGVVTTSSSSGGVDYTCDKEWETCSGWGGQGSCCPGYKCNGDANFAQCHLDPNRDKSGGCKDMYQACTGLGQCCVGSYCDMSGGSNSWMSCRPGQEGATPAPTPSSMINNDAASFSLGSITGDCPYSPNLGDGFSGATGQGHFVGPWPDVQGVPALGMADGRDDSVSFFVGGNYFGNVGSEIEGKIVVLGNFKNNGINSLVQVGLGSQIIPNNDQDVILVGGDWEMNVDVSVMQNSAHVKGNIKYKGSSVGTAQNLWSNGQVDHVANLDLSVYEKALGELKVKSAHWASLPMNGIYVPYNQGPNGNTAVFKAGNNNDCVQVFNLSEDEFDSLPWGIHVQFDESLKYKTILINYGSDSNNQVQIKNLANFYDPWGKSGWEFDSDTTASILWNFYDATQVDLGAGSSGVGEFTGSILVPNGSMKFEMPGHSGRTIVGGNLEQNFAGSEFHNYPFEPNPEDATCQLPLPPCGSEPTPTPSPTNTPTHGFSGSHPGYTPLSTPSTKITGVTQPNSNPIVVGVQNCLNVGFGMTNQYGTTVDYVFVQYTNPKSGLPVCEAFKNVATDWFAEFSSNCMRSTKAAVVTITVVDSAFSVDDSASLPFCCGDNEILGEIAGAADNRAVKYTHLLDCCPEATKCA